MIRTASRATLITSAPTNVSALSPTKAITSHRLGSMQRGTRRCPQVAWERLANRAS